MRTQDLFKKRNDDGELSLNLTVNLHYSTQTRRNTLPKAIGHALQTFATAFVMSSVLLQLFDIQISVNPHPNFIPCK